MNTFLAFLSLGFFLTATAGALSLSFPVEHDHFWGKGRGQLTIDDNGIVFEEGEKTHSRTWAFTDVQEIRIESPRELLLWTYEDVGWKLNQDRVFKFKLVDGEMSSDLVTLLQERLPGRVVSAVFAPPPDVSYTIPAKHEHALGGGCEGQLVFGAKEIHYVSSGHPEHNRVWLIDDIESLGRRSDFDLRITVRERSPSGSFRNFQFQLKKPLDRQAYEDVWRKIYEPETWLQPRLAVSR